MNKKSKREKKTVEFKLMLRPSEKQWIEEKADELGLTMTNIVRMFNLNTKKIEG